MVPFVYHAANRLTQYVLLPPYGSLRVIGLENLPLTGPIIIASNHLNDADPGGLSTRIPRRLVFMTKVELFRVPLLGQFLRAYGAFPVRRHQADLSALRQANDTLKRGLALVIFPEGTRSGRTIGLKEAWPGAGLIALRNDAPIVPVAITGSQRLELPWMFLHPFPRARITLTIGQPFRLPKPERINAASAQAGSHLIMKRIAALLPPEYRGYYGEERQVASSK
ncbi:MAG TPA: lysophospholipid acyltransferase family protein [Dehalococcoidia bacterium]|nr:lysophospholipid acyltransferase family protein [Dehalococcoidia bacterium]